MRVAVRHHAEVHFYPAPQCKSDESQDDDEVPEIMLHALREDWITKNTTLREMVQ